MTFHVVMLIALAAFTGSMAWWLGREQEKRYRRQMLELKVERLLREHPEAMQRLRSNMTRCLTAFGQAMSDAAAPMVELGRQIQNINPKGRQ